MHSIELTIEQATKMKNDNEDDADTGMSHNILPVSEFKCILFVDFYSTTNFYLTHSEPLPYCSNADDNKKSNTFQLAKRPNVLNKIAPTIFSFRSTLRSSVKIVDHSG